LKPGKNQVGYLSNGSKIAALLYLPDSMQAGQKYPAVVLTPPNTGVKEQTASLYAEGFITMAFDPRGFGESGSHPVLFDLGRQIEDVSSSIDSYETADDPRIKAQAMVSPVYLSEEDNILPVPMDVAYAVSGFSKLLYNISGTDIELGPLVVDTPNSENEPETNLGAGRYAGIYGIRH